MVLCGFCLAADPAKTLGLELEIETEVTPKDDRNPMTRGRASASQISAYFDEIFGKLGNWLAHAFSDNRPIDGGNLSSSVVFMSGERAAFLGDPNAYRGGKFPGSGSYYLDPGKPLDDLLLPEGNDGPRIEVKSGKTPGATAEDGIENPFLRHSRAAIDQYFTANVVRTRKSPVTASRRSESPQSKMSVKAFRSLSALNSTVAFSAIQSVPEPSSVLFCGFAAVVFTWHRRRPRAR